MATIRFRKGKYQAQVRRQGFPRQYRSFLSKKEAQAWARRTETQLEMGEIPSRVNSDLTLADLIIRYRETVTPGKKGRPQESRRLARLLKDPIANTKLQGLTPTAQRHGTTEPIHHG